MSNFATGKKSKAISDRSGMAFPYDEMRKEWNGALVHQSEFEAKHPQLEPKVYKGDAQGLQNARPDRVEPPVPQLLTNDAFTSGIRDSIIINVNAVSHGFTTGQTVRFRNTESKFPEYPEVSHLEGHDVDVAHLTPYEIFRRNAYFNQCEASALVPGLNTIAFFAHWFPAGTGPPEKYVGAWEATCQCHNAYGRTNRVIYDCKVS